MFLPEIERGKQEEFNLRLKKKKYQKELLRGINVCFEVKNKHLVFSYHMKAYRIV